MRDRLRPVDGEVAIVGANRSALFCADWLRKAGVGLRGATDLTAARERQDVSLLVVAGDAMVARGVPTTQSEVHEIWLWDFERGTAGCGEFASAVSGVSAVIGFEEGKPAVLPSRIPEQWCGLFGASFVMAFLADSTDAGRKLVEISTADVLRAFAEQNSGNHMEVPYGWRRNGTIAVEHGGVFPQGFFRCKDGHVALVARSRQDWHAILDALENPEWSRAPRFQDPFALSRDGTEAIELLSEELSKYTRGDLLERALTSGATMAPVLTSQEALDWNVYGSDFVGPEGLRLPFRAVYADESVME